jgi:hypothetical protein
VLEPTAGLPPAAAATIVDDLEMENPKKIKKLLI